MLRTNSAFCGIDILVCEHPPQGILALPSFVPKWRLVPFAIVLACLISHAPAAPPVLPTPTDARLTIELVAAEPMVATPTGIAADVGGRVWVIENKTHFRPKDYPGHPTDRILVLDDFAPDGRARRVTQFADGLKDSMSLALGKGGAVYVVTRSAIQLLRDTDGDGRADERKTLVRLETKATYPHNGLNGITFSPDGEFMYFCLGLNTGFSYKVIGSDGSAVAGGGEGGSIWRCRPDGSKVERFAAGFWNCHDLTFDAFGRLFAVDNDPDDRPPCRLLDIIEGGDYGWKFINGRRGNHPFTSWNGELPGTLPMVSATGEAPSGVLAYESSGLPDEYRGRLLVTSWGDHVVQHFKLEPKGASFTSRPETLVEGGPDFRPVGIATAPDGSVLVADWADKSYPVHGKGRVWRIRMKTPPTPGTGPPATRQATRLAASETRRNDDANDPFVVSAAITALSRSARLKDWLDRGVDVTRWGVVETLAARRSGNAKAEKLIPALLRHADPDVRRVTLQWAGEQRLKQFASLVPLALKAGPVTRGVFEAVIACQDKLTSPPPAEGQSPPEWAGARLAADVLLDPARDAAVRRLALELADPRDARLTADKLHSLLPAAGVEAVRALAWRGDESSVAALRALAADESHDPAWRREAIAGLAAAAASPPVKDTLLALLHAGPPPLRAEALRSLRGVLTRADAGRVVDDFRAAVAKPDLGTADDRREWAEQILLAFKSTSGILTDADRRELQGHANSRPANEKEWLAALAASGDPEAGRRVFFHANAARCFTCHAVNHRGGNVGPDLSHIGGAVGRQKIVESILDPSREIAPLYVSVVLTLKTGDVLAGVAGLEDVGSNFVQIRDAGGRVTKVKADDIAARRPESVSLMPANLADGLTVREFRDLVAFLEKQK